jgi:ABC-type multidrug transport system fused ATPase/permease subunit
MTSIIIAHRFDTIRNCDKIVVIDDSKIVESGNYNELINKKGMFYKLK